MSSIVIERKMSAAVVYSSRFGTTARVAKSVEAGLKEAGMQTLCASIEEIAPETLKQYDLICVGSPTEIFSAPKQMKDFLKHISGMGLGGKFGFAFDTKYDSRVSGSAAKFIEHALDDQGLRIITSRKSAIVTSTKTGGQLTGAALKDGEERRFERLGLRIGELAAEAIARYQYVPN